MTELIKLEQNITDTIKESQIKLGFTPNAVTLFYPLDSLNAITGGELTAEPVQWWAHVERDILVRFFGQYIKISTHTLTWSVTFLCRRAAPALLFQLTRSRGA